MRIYLNPTEWNDTHAYTYITYSRLPQDASLLPSMR